MVGIFAQPEFGDASGLLFGGGLVLFKAQFIGVVAVFFWTVLTSGILFLIIKHTVGLRVTAIEELKGLDIGEHGMEAYAGFEIIPTR